MIDVVGLLKEGARLASIVLGRRWGDQTSRESQIRALAEEALAKKQEAYRKWMEAHRAKDLVKSAEYHSAYNGWSAELKRLQHQAAAERA